MKSESISEWNHELCLKKKYHRFRGKSEIKKAKQQLHHSENLVEDSKIKRYYNICVHIIAENIRRSQVI